MALNYRLLEGQGKRGAGQRDRSFPLPPVPPAPLPPVPPAPLPLFSPAPLPPLTDSLCPPAPLVPPTGVFSIGVSTGVISLVTTLDRETTAR